MPFSNFRLFTGVMFFRGFLDFGNSNVLNLIPQSC